MNFLPVFFFAFGAIGAFKHYIKGTGKRRRIIEPHNAAIEVFNGDCRDPNAYHKLGLGPESGKEQADILITDPPYCLLERRRKPTKQQELEGKTGNLRDPKKRMKKIDDSPAVPRYANIKEYRKFTRDW